MVSNGYLAGYQCPSEGLLSWENKLVINAFNSSKPYHWQVWEENEIVDVYLASFCFLLCGFVYD